MVIPTISNKLTPIIDGIKVPYIIVRIMFFTFVSLVRKSTMHCGKPLSDVRVVSFMMKPKRDEEEIEREIK